MHRQTGNKSLLFNADSLKASAISAGFTSADVAAPWFTETHLHAVKVLGRNVQDVRGLALHQLKGLLKNLSRAQVEDVRFTEWHAKAIEKGLLYDQVISVEPYKLRCCTDGDLTFGQVNHAWFSSVHAEAIQDHLPYDEIANKSDTQVQQLIEEYKAMNEHVDQLEVIADEEFSRYFNENPNQRGIFQAAAEKKEDDENPLLENQQKKSP